GTGPTQACSSSSSPTTRAATTPATTPWPRTGPLRRPRPRPRDARRPPARSAPPHPSVPVADRGVLIGPGRTLRGPAAPVGVADAASPTGELETTGRALEAAMIHEALADAGLTLDDVDGVAYAGSAAGLAEFLGIRPRYLDGTVVGGSSYELHVEHAAAAIAAGLCDVVIGVYAATPRSDRRRPGAGR